jgi:hypothetical protein
LGNVAVPSFSPYEAEWWRSCCPPFYPVLDRYQKFFTATTIFAEEKKSVRAELDLRTTSTNQKYFFEINPGGISPWEADTNKIWHVTLLGAIYRL